MARTVIVLCVLLLEGRFPQDGSELKGQLVGGEVLEAPLFGAIQA